MKRVFNFSAGPAVLPLDVLMEAQSEMLDYEGTGMSVMEMSHRSAPFEKILNEAISDLKEIMNCYKIYNEIASEVTDSTDRNIQDILYYAIMKQKGYKISYDCYKKLKQNKLLSLICKK